MENGKKGLNISEELSQRRLFEKICTMCSKTYFSKDEDSLYCKECWDIEVQRFKEINGIKS